MKSANSLPILLGDSVTASSGITTAFLNQLARSWGMLLLACLCLSAHAQTGEWAWMNGSNTVGSNGGQPGVYGNPGQAAPGNVPGGRELAMSWSDSNGNLWLFGGWGYDANDALGSLNDLWMFSTSTNEWTWISGSSTIPSGCDLQTWANCGQPGVYGKQGTPAPGNTPGGRQMAATWVDGSGNLWLFGGGYGYDANGNVGSLNDLWEFNPSTAEWTWVGGNSTMSCAFWDRCASQGVYGALGTHAAGNIPPGRMGASTWADGSGNLWLFGGSGYYASDADGWPWCSMNDLWKFDLATKEWTWMGGSIGGNGSQGVYGILGVPAAGNIPLTRGSAASWTGSNGNFWLFGGFDGNNYYWHTSMNDLWEFFPSTNEWVWLEGLGSVTSDLAHKGIYGSLGVPVASNIPGGRKWEANWTDASGNFWLFGGVGSNCCGGTTIILNDLWVFNPSSNVWANMGGSAQFGGQGVYGKQGTPSAGNWPGGRNGQTGWTDASGNFWLFGGDGFDANPKGGGPLSGGLLNDLWKYEPGSLAWPAANPFFSVTPGTYTSVQTVSLTDITPGATIYYTLDGTTPTGASAQYTSPLTISQTTTINAIAKAAGYSTSSVASGAYTINTTPAATPTFSPAAGVYTTFVTVTLSDSTAGAVIYYTTDGSAPTAAAAQYSSPITLSQSRTVNAIAVAPGFANSAVGTATYTLNLPVTAAPTFSPAAGKYTTPQTVKLTDSNKNAAIYYTFDGSVPTISSAQYTGPLTISQTTTVNAVAIAPESLYSPVVNATYTINLPVTATPAFNVPAGTYTTVQSVKLSDTTTGATIYYTLDGSTPTSASAKYSTALTIGKTTTVKAIASSSGYSNSAVASATYTINLPQAAAPTFSVAAGTYTAVQSVSLADKTTGATIYYTSDGSTPTTSSAKYTAPIKVSQTTTINAIAMATGYLTSAVASATYTINLPAATPTFSPAAGTYTSIQTVTLSDATPNATIFYTTNGATPTAQSAQYSAPLTLSKTTTVKAFATAAGSSTSAVASATYTINLTAVAPTFTPPAGTYGAAQSVTLATTTPGATLYYTTNGATPTTASTKYTAPITVKVSETVKAIATVSGYANSPVASAAYLIVGAPTVTTGKATSIATPKATLNATVNTLGASGQAWFVWGTSATTLSNTTSASTLPASASTQNVSANITGLAAKTTYYFQAVATTVGGTTSGTVQNFKTN